MALIGSVSASALDIDNMSTTGSFGNLAVATRISGSNPASVLRVNKLIVEDRINLAGTEQTAQTAGTSGTEGGTGAAGGTGGLGSQGAQGGTGGIGAQGAQGGTGSKGSTGATGGAGGTGGGGGTGGTGGAGGTGGTGAKGAGGDTGSQGGQGAQGGGGGTGGTGAKGGIGAQGAQGGTGGTGGTGGGGAQGPTGPQGPSGVSPYWTSNATLTWTGTKVLRGSGNYVYTTQIRNSGANGWGLIVKSGGTNVQLQNFSGTAVIQMYSNGNVTPSPMSDRRVKRNIRDFPTHSIEHSGSAISEIMHLDGLAKTFNMQQEDTGSWPAELKATEPDPNFPWNLHTGYIAQEVNAITGSDGVSGSVHVSKFVQRIQEDINDVLKDDAETFFSFDYDGLASLKAQATIDLIKEVEGLKLRVQALEG